ncbi:DUF3800 domain-containing protein [Pseudomonas sp. YeP6b]|uniref:DUF3800 domain-containing protein n=1 Tax=Pseudomonas sp. YeP6b TaxID=2861775 RepID=UPI0021D98D9F|nr:DUF3800 domain-containing protein [Pseudomonas sp. YeP6b]UXZ23903.1 DUF3800 domain-containing protein [Pseudomonas sp. YeP6b]
MYYIEVKDKYKLYYDESNNMRVFSLREGKYNIDNDPNQKISPIFVLAGIALKENQSDLNFEALQQSLRLQKTADELKFRNIVAIKSNFTPHQALKFTLGNRRISNILSWLIDNDVSIHAFSINTAYWSSLDIIEDLLYFNADKEEILSQHYYKDCLYKMIKLDKVGYIDLLNRFGYPKIEKEQAVHFLKALHEFNQEIWGKLVPKDLERIDQNSDCSNLMRLGYFIYKRLTLNADDLEFRLVYEKDEKVLIGDFSTFYINRISTFPESEHVLDDEDQVEPLIDSVFSAMDKADKYDYKFISSVGSLPIQVADCIAGIFRVLLAYLEDASLDDVTFFKKGLNAMEDATFSKLKSLLERSIEECGLLFHAVMVPADLEKYEELFADQLVRHGPNGMFYNTQ